MCCKHVRLSDPSTSALYTQKFHQHLKKVGRTRKPHLVPEPGVEQVQHSMLSAAHIQVHRHPVFLGLGIEHALRVGGVNEAQVVPAGARPLGHGACLPCGWTPCTNHTVDRVRKALDTLRLLLRYLWC